MKPKEYIIDKKVKLYLSFNQPQDATCGIKANQTVYNFLKDALNFLSFVDPLNEKIIVFLIEKILIKNINKNSCEVIFEGTNQKKKNHIEVYCKIDNSFIELIKKLLSSKIKSNCSYYIEIFINKYLVSQL